MKSKVDDRLRSIPLTVAGPNLIVARRHIAGVRALFIWLFKVEEIYKHLRIPHVIYYPLKVLVDQPIIIY